MRFVSKYFLFVLVSLIVIACPVSDPPTCQKSEECTVSGFCCIEKDKSEGICKAKEDCGSKACSNSCKNQSDCFNNQECKDSCCTKKTAIKPKNCEKDNDCSGGQECNQSKCEACVQDCQTTTECSGEDSCVHGCCKLPPCSSDKDCSDRNGKLCDKNSGKCVKCLKTEDCTEKEICKKGNCKNVECTLDSHCASSSKPSCNQQTNRCQAKIVCKTDSDCEQLYPGGIRNRCDANANGGKGECKKGSCVPCSSDNSCGGSGDFCIGKDKGLKDGKRCLLSCKDAKDCPQGFTCSGALVNGFKVCFPISSYCEDPCKSKQCPAKHTCVEGACIKNPEVCDACTKDDTCGKGNKCLFYSPKKSFCTKPCQSTADCPTDRAFTCLNNQCFDTNECVVK